MRANRKNKNKNKDFTLPSVDGIDVMQKHNTTSVLLTTINEHFRKSTNM